MGRVQVSLEPTTPLSLRLIAWLRLPALAGGVAIGLAAFAFFLVYSTLFGGGPARLTGLVFEGAWGAELIQAFFLGFTIAVVAGSVDTMHADVEALRPFLSASVLDEPDLARRVLRYPRGLLVVSGLVGVASSFPTVLSAEMWSGGRMPGWADATVVWFVARNGLTWWIVLRGLVLELVLGRNLSRLAEQVEHVDLVGRAAFAPCSRRALRTVSSWMLLAAWLSLMYVGRGWIVTGLMPLGLLTLASFAFTAFLLPLLGPHRRLRAAKAHELSRVRAVLDLVRERVIGADPREVSGGRLMDLVAYEARIMSASEWPIEASTVVRFGFYVALGLGSWVGAGLVQHAIEQLIR